MIILRTKTFSDKKGKNDDSDAMRGFVGKLVEDYLRKEKSKQHGRPGRQERKLNRLKRRIEQTDNEIEIQKKTEELKNKKATLDEILNPKNDKSNNKVNKVAEKLKDPKFKKGLKVAGLTTLGIGAATGLIAGGIKLKKKLDEEKSNKKMKEQITTEDKK